MIRPKSYSSNSARCGAEDDAAHPEEIHASYHEIRIVSCVCVKYASYHVHVKSAGFMTASIYRYYNNEPSHGHREDAGGDAADDAAHKPLGST